MTTKHARAPMTVFGWCNDGHHAGLPGTEGTCPGRGSGGVWLDQRGKPIPYEVPVCHCWCHDPKRELQLTAESVTLKNETTQESETMLNPNRKLEGTDLTQDEVDRVFEAQYKTTDDPRVIKALVQAREALRKDGAK